MTIQEAAAKHLRKPIIMLSLMRFSLKEYIESPSEESHLTLHWICFYYVKKGKK